MVYECLFPETELGHAFDACVGLSVQACLCIYAGVIKIKPTRVHWEEREKKVG